MEDSNMAQDEKWLAIEKPFGRRRLLTSAAGLGGGAAAGLLPAGCSTPNAGAGIGATTLVATDATTADTTAGKVRGFSRNGIHTFIGFSPVVDGKIVTRHPFDPDAPDVSSNVPMIIGTVLNEQSPSMNDAPLESMSEDEMKKRAAERYGNQAGVVVDAYRKAYPSVKPVELLSRMFSVRTNAVTQAERKAAKGAAPAYMYLFAWQTPLLDGRPRAFHCSEIPFVFYNTDVSAFATGGGAEARAQAAKVSDAWINFARKGDPNHGGLAPWPAYNAQQGPVMIFDKTCEVKNDPDRELRKVVAEALG